MMKYLKLTAHWLVIVCLLLGVSCRKKINEDVSFSEVMAEIKESANLENSKEEDLKDMEVAERYGINPNDVEEGIVYYSDNKDTPDKIILVKAKDEDALENVEEALSSEVIGMTDAWKDNKDMGKRVSEHIIKTKDKYVVFIISDNPKKIEEIFDNSLNA